MVIDYPVFGQKGEFKMENNFSPIQAGRGREIAPAIFSLRSRL